LEADVRGHIRLEHEMKIHMDYLEAQTEEYENVKITWEQEKKGLYRRIA
jgi:hypothetical protein